ncbi:hypothetical protein C0J52_12017 [Blattella germanica]|nr:hypothetical protein C0J52_12017 [Blattella germanica]
MSHREKAYRCSMFKVRHTRIFLHNPKQTHQLRRNLVENLSLLRLKLRMRATFSVVYAEFNDSWEEESESEVQHPSEITPFREEDKVVGSHVIVTYEGKYYPGIITGIRKKGTLINVMEQTGKHWR